MLDRALTDLEKTDAFTAFRIITGVPNERQDDDTTLLAYKHIF